MLRRNMILRAAAVATLALALLPVNLPAAFAQADKVVAVVNGTEINEATLAVAAAEFGSQLEQIPEEQRRKVLIDVLVDMTILAGAARAEKLDESDDYKTRLEFLKIRTLRNEYFEKKVGASVTEADVKARYEADMKGSESPIETKARHILVKTEEEAAAIIVELDGGADFAELANAKSTDPSGPNGGDLGYFAKDRMVKPFADAAFAMEPGSHSKEPVQSQFGWHVIKVDDRRQQPKPTLEEMSDQVRELLVRERFIAAIADLKATAKVEILDAKQE